MKHHLRWKKTDRYWKGLIIPVLVFAFLIVFLTIGVNNISHSSDEESMKVLKDAVQRATVQCYAIEGVYPPSVEYLEKNYGVIVDKSKYVVHYDVFAGNIMPTITVIALN